MQDIEIILSISGTALGLLVTTLTFLMKFIKNAKAKKLAENIIAVSNAVIPYIEEAENFSGYSGKEKKEYVMTKANQYAIEHKIKFDSELVGSKVEELVTLTKQVNNREKDSAAASRSAAVKGIVLNK